MYGHGFECAYPVSPVMPGCGGGFPLVAGAEYGPNYGPGYGAGKAFALIVVLFILLIIIGASYCKC